MRQNQTNIFKFIVALTGLFSAIKVYGQTVLYSGNQHTADLDNQKYDNAYEMRQQIDSAAKKLLIMLVILRVFLNPRIQPQWI